jgi:enterobacterial common antigen flippase
LNLQAGTLRRRALFARAPYLFLVLSTAVRLATGLFLFKYLAWQFGPATFGLLTQVIGIAAIFYLFAGGGITNGVIRNISATSSETERGRWLSAGTTITILSSITLAAVAFALALFGERALFGEPGYKLVFVGIAATQVLVGFGNLALAYFSGIGDNRTFATVQIIANVLSLALLVLFTQSIGLRGAIFGLIVGPATTGVVALWLFFRQTSSHDLLHMVWDRPLLKNLLSYAAVMASSVAAVPLAQLLIRIDLSDRLGWEAVGYWQAAAKISDANMQFIGVIIINYLLPQLSSRQDATSALRMLFRMGALLLGVLVVICALIYAARDYLILIIYSEEFLTASSLILPQLAGDILKAATLLVYYYFMSRGRVFIVFVSELALGIAIYLLYLIMVPSYGATAPIYAYTASYAVAFLFMTGLLLVVKQGTNPLK